MSFDSFELDPALLAGVRDMGFTEPTDIQRDAIPWALEGRDLLACAMTGSGKTAAFALPILQRVMHLERGTTRALVLSPTRELALQIEQHFHEMAAHTPVQVASIYGGVGYEPQERAFREGHDVIIATPGRLLDLLGRPWARLDGLEVLVLDEADRMLDMGFIPDVRRILKHVPKQRQTLFFSATLAKPIVRLAGDMLVDPVTINLERRSEPAAGVRQAVYPVRHELKPALLLHLVQRQDVDSALVFTRTKDRADLVGGYLKRAGIKVAVIHGDRTQQHRTKVMKGFKEGRYQVLVATDVAARGIDVEDLSHVINLDVPNQPDDYIHRVGRTARAGATGDALTFVAARELADLHLIEKSIGQKLERIRLVDFDYSNSAAAESALRPRSPLPMPAVASGSGEAGVEVDEERDEGRTGGGGLRGGGGGCRRRRGDGGGRWRRGAGEDAAERTAGEDDDEGETRKEGEDVEEDEPIDVEDGREGEAEGVEGRGRGVRAGRRQRTTTTARRTATTPRTTASAKTTTSADDDEASDDDDGRRRRRARRRRRRRRLRRRRRRRRAGRRRATTDDDDEDDDDEESDEEQDDEDEYAEDDDRRRRGRGRRRRRRRRGRRRRRRRGGRRRGRGRRGRGRRGGGRSGSESASRGGRPRAVRAAGRALRPGASALDRFAERRARRGGGRRSPSPEPRRAPRRVEPQRPEAAAPPPRKAAERPAATPPHRADDHRADDHRADDHRADERRAAAPPRTAAERPAPRAEVKERRRPAPDPELAEVLERFAELRQWRRDHGR